MPEEERKDSCSKISLNYTDIFLMKDMTKKARIDRKKRERRDFWKDTILYFLFAVGLITYAEVLFILIYFYLLTLG